MQVPDGKAKSACIIASRLEQSPVNERDRVYAALRASVAQALSSAELDLFDAPRARRKSLVEAHLAILRAFAKAVGAAFNWPSTEEYPDIVVDGRLEGAFQPDGNPDTGRLRFCIGRSEQVSEGDDRFVAVIRDLWFPAEIQAHGYGACLIQGLICLWRTMGVEEVRASSNTPAGIVAFNRWGFEPQEQDVNGFTPFVYSL
jgi:hypothetical protein